MCIFIQNMKFLCSNLWIGELCTDTDAKAANDNDAQREKHDDIASFGIYTK